MLVEHHRAGARLEAATPKSPTVCVVGLYKTRHRKISSAAGATTGVCLEGGEQALQPLNDMIVMMVKDCCIGIAFGPLELLL